MYIINEIIKRNNEEIMNNYDLTEKEESLRIVRELINNAIEFAGDFPLKINNKHIRFVKGNESIDIIYKGDVA